MFISLFKRCAVYTIIGLILFIGVHMDINNTDNNTGASIEARVNKLIVYIVKHLELGSLSEEEQRFVKEEVLKEISTLLIEVGKVLLSFNEDPNIAIQRRKVMEFKKIIGSMVNNWSVTDLNLLIKLDDNKWKDFMNIMAKVARTLAREARERAYFADIIPQKEDIEIMADIDAQFEKVHHVLNTNIPDIATDINSYMDHTNQVVDMFEVKNHQLREALNSALFKLTEVRLSFHQMDQIGTNSSEEQSIRKDIEYGAKQVAKKHGIVSTSQIIRESKGY